MYLRKKEAFRWPFHDSVDNASSTPKTSIFRNEDQTSVRVPPPEIPKILKRNRSLAQTEFKGFSVPPRDDFNYDFSTELDTKTRNSRSLLHSKPDMQRAVACWETVKTGFQMGAWVGAIFGGLTGCYGVIQYRNFSILPLSLISGGLSFGFFLGCGMLVRCNATNAYQQGELRRPKQFP